MLVNHYRKDFIDKIVGKRVIIIAHQDVDAVCAVKILTSLFKTEGIAYILLSCGGVSELKAKYEEYASQSNIFILVNCGASIDLFNLLDNPNSEKIFFVLDAHRPIHILNYYNSSGQIRLISGLEPEENVPEFDQVFAEDPEVSDDSDEDEEMDDEDDEIDDNGMTGRMRRRAGRQQKRQQFISWEAKRKKLLFDYTEFAYYARPSALYALEVAWVMTRDDMDSIWCTIVALTDSYAMGRISRTKYTEFASTVNDHILRITNAEKLPRDCLKIRFERELFLFLYRSWSFYESAKVTPYFVSTLRMWSLEGSRRFHQMLAHLGLPLVEVKQKYTNMSLDLRRQLVEMFTSETVVEKYKLADLVFGSFIAEIGYRPKFNALDVQLSALAVLEDPDTSKSGEVKFIDAMQLLNCRDADAFRVGVEKAKAMLKQVQSQVQMMVDMKQIQEVGPFLYVLLSDSILDFNYFKRPTIMPLLARFLQHAGVKSGKRKWKQSPWVIMVPHSTEYFCAYGVPPSSFEQAERNNFPEAFRVIQSKMSEDVVAEFFEGWATLVKNVKRQAFSDQLLYLSE